MDRCSRDRCSRDRCSRSRDRGIAACYIQRCVRGNGIGCTLGYTNLLILLLPLLVEKEG